MPEVIDDQEMVKNTKKVLKMLDELKKQGIIEVKPDGTIVAKKPPTKRKSRKNDEDKK
jgi:Mn-dependent DtxR family transcriptional regulator